MRLIDADLLKGQMESVCMGIMAGTDSYGPTVDAVEVIRCKDCVFFHRYGFKLEYTECRRSDCHATEDGYCCWAERREDDNH